MKLLLVASLLASVAYADKEYHKIKKWAMHKACESCMGEAATKMFMIKIKTSVAECMQIDAPELDLPMFQAPFRAVNALVHATYNKGEGRPGQGSGGDSPMPYLEEMFKRMMLKRMVKRFMDEEFVDDDDDDDDDDEGVNMNFFNSFKKHQMRRRNRYQRDADDSKKAMFELGDRLNAKLQSARAAKESKIGNFTCVLRKCGVIDSNGDLNSEQALVDMWKGYPINGDDGDGWLRNKLEEGTVNCKKFAEAIPQEILEQCPYGPQLAKVKMFKKCLKMCKLKTCMNYDIKTQLEANVPGGLQELLDTTQLEERELLPLVMTLLHGPEMDM